MTIYLIWTIINFYYFVIFFQLISSSIVRAQIHPPHKLPPRFNIRNRDRCNAKQEKPPTSTRPVSSSNWYTAFFNFIPLFPPRRDGYWKTNGQPVRGRGLILKGVESRYRYMEGRKSFSNCAQSSIVTWSNRRMEDNGNFEKCGRKHRDGPIRGGKFSIFQPLLLSPTNLNYIYIIYRRTYEHTGISFFFHLCSFPVHKT